MPLRYIRVANRQERNFRYHTIEKLESENAQIIPYPGTP